MRWFRIITMKLRMLFARGQATSDLDRELSDHLDRQIAENRAAGMSPDEARSAALRAFGNPPLLRDQARATWNWSALESLMRDLRYSVRTLFRAPGFALTAILVMGLGIGANVALFTVVRGVLLKPLPFNEPSRLMMLYESDPKSFDHNIVSGGVYAEWKKHNRSFSNLALMQDSPYALSASGGQLPEKLTGAKVSWNFLSTLGVAPAYGRDFTSADDTLSAGGTVLLSWSLWQRRFGGDPGIVNRTIYLDAKPYTVIGVMPRWFVFPQSATQIWTPVYHEVPASLMTMIDDHMFRVVGRLNPGVPATQGVADLAVISRRIHDEHLDMPFVMPSASIRPLLEHMVGDLKRPLYVLLAATGCLLLIACLNVANLLVARACARRRELAIRTALGGGWLRLLRERLLESVLISAAGGALGLALAWGALQWLARMRQDMSRIEGVHIDGLVAAFTVAVIAFSSLFAGLISAFSGSNRQVLSALQDSSRGQSGSRSRSGLRRTLLTFEVGLTVVLLIGAGLLLKSYQRLRSTDMGCATQNVLTMRIGLPGARYKTPGEAPVNFFRSFLERVRALPGVDAAGLITAVPGQGFWEDSGFTIVEHPPLPLGQTNDALSRWADPGYFAAIGIPILRGRTFNEGLRLAQANEVVISDGLAKQFFPGEDPLGKHLRTNDKTYSVVGVVGDMRHEIGEPPMATKYFSLNEGGENYSTLVIRSSRNAEQLALPVQRVIQQMDRDLPVADVLTMEQLLGKGMLDQSFNTTLLAGFAFLSLVLAAVGLFGVLSFIVAQRTGEIGIRMALGAPRAQVMTATLLDGLRPALIGLGIGLTAGIAAARLLRSMLYETSSLDPVVLAGVAATLFVVAVVACVLPAWRASRINPMQALRTE